VLFYLFKGVFVQLCLLIDVKSKLLFALFVLVDLLELAVACLMQHGHGLIESVHFVLPGHDIRF
jgi:hypothetical protein